MCVYVRVCVCRSCGNPDIAGEMVRWREGAFFEKREHRKKEMCAGRVT